MNRITWSEARQYRSKDELLTAIHNHPEEITQCIDDEGDIAIYIKGNLNTIFKSGNAYLFTEIVFEALSIETIHSDDWYREEDGTVLIRLDDIVKVTNDRESASKRILELQAEIKRLEDLT